MWISLFQNGMEIQDKKFSLNIYFNIKEIVKTGENFWEKSCERGLQGEEKCAEYSLGA